MPCTEHNWLFDIPCPTCHPEEVIPDFLKRNPDNTFVYPLNNLSAGESAERRKLEYKLDEEREAGLVTVAETPTETPP